jgi:hypothetical protein
MVARISTNDCSIPGGKGHAENLRAVGKFETSVRGE